METISFSKAFKYPFNRPMRLFYILLIFLPIIGWFALTGYIVKIINEFIEGKYEELPQLQFMEDLKLGFLLFLKSLPFFLVYIILIEGASYLNETFGIILNLLGSFFILPILTINFYRKQTVSSYFEFGILKCVTENFEDYVSTFIKQFVLILIFAVLSIVLIGIPAASFTSYIFFANFYGRRVLE
ncbi:MAG: DUF4013 domain-containing protein [Methanosarcinaceae archaeon]|nr:DUF4013 domain-containing protein [Methanosarcinaceae archaeon]MDD4332431.1 DUF4013 domain-containing protein [Methanosarcinaceae archaeon]MDD4749983.1 DUF4013 domain-containing protein [Methanosarcinaceae archaeon]